MLILSRRLVVYKTFTPSLILATMEYLVTQDITLTVGIEEVVDWSEWTTLNTDKYTIQPIPMMLANAHNITTEAACRRISTGAPHLYLSSCQQSSSSLQYSQQAQSWRVRFCVQVEQQSRSQQRRDV